MRKFRPPVALISLVLIAVAAVSFCVSLTIGSVQFSLSDVWSVVYAHVMGGPTPSDKGLDAVVWAIRVPRGLLALIVGAGLAIAGVTVQTLVRNPLADPYLLGVSSGASVGATAVIALGVFSGFGIYALNFGALVGALAATATVYFITLAQGSLSPLRLILSGVVLSSAFSAMASFLVFRSSDARSAQSVMFWMLGSVAGAGWDNLIPGLILVIVAVIVLMLLSSQCDALAAGPDTAMSLGVRVDALRRLLFALQAIVVGGMVAVAGGIGFVGLVIPHLARMLVGSLHRRLVPVAALMGAIFLLWVDMLARIAAPPQEIPLGVVTGIIGAPLFLILMGRKRYAFGGEQ
ncbi:Iron(3+)-hydroxamate import system permease protein fhuG [Corynebacterium kutscheri]|uniref:FecCD family ABC transporter permease n=1 Tax=Corynebacterium kutscheri TaxID=35755 RepID=UPI000F6D1DAA|nr:iron ABC transporter permease [Corynebacterium kutscheri]VEH79392.1 Iron(3+)-hydroxamate import system permease protein fhuG [Corynebacterium kutscheri]